MSAIFIRRIVDAFILVFSVGIGIRIFGVVSSLNSGGAGNLHWPVQSAAADNAVPFGDAASIASSSAELIVTGQFGALLFDSAASLAMLILFLFVLFTLRKVLIQFAKGETFTQDNVTGIRNMGLALVGVCAVSLVHAVVIQFIILGAVDVPVGSVLHASLSWDAPGMDNVWLDYEVPLFTFVLGCIALLFSEAFRSGLAYREDSESVV